MESKKSLILIIAVSIILSWFGWAAVYRSLYLAHDHYWSYPLILFYLALIFLSIYILAEKNNNRIYLLIFVCTFPCLIIAKAYWYLMLPIWIIANLLIIIAVYRIIDEKNNRIRIYPNSLVRFGMPIITTALALLISANYYLSIKDNTNSNAPKFKIQIPNEIIYQGLDVTGVIFPDQEVKMMTQDISVDDFIKQNLQSNDAGSKEQIFQMVQQNQKRTLTDQEKMFIQSQLANTTNNQQAEIIVEARGALSKQVGQQLTGNEKMKDIMVGMVNDRLDSFFNGNKENEQLLPLGIALALLLTIKSIGWILGYPLAWTIRAVFHIMVKMKLLRLEKVMKEVEQIS